MDSDADVGVELSDIVSDRSSPDATDLNDSLAAMVPMPHSASPRKKGKKVADSSKKQRKGGGKGGKKKNGKSALASSQGDRVDLLEEAVLFDESGDIS